MTDNFAVNKVELRKALCSSCGGLRNCEILGQHIVHGGDEYVDWWNHWYLLQCRGCELVFVQNVSTFSEDYDIQEDLDGQQKIVLNETVRYWPALAKRRPPSWLEEISRSSLPEVDALESALRELYGALDNDLNMLAGIGIRTCFDKASEALGIAPDLTFKKKLDGLVKAGHIGIVDQNRLETLVDAGSASAHRGWTPTADDLATMMDVLEHFLEAAFISPMRKATLDKKLGMVKGKVPKRSSTPKSPGVPMPAAPLSHIKKKTVKRK